MKKKTIKKQDKDMLPEYDLAGKKGERGKYFQDYRHGHTVRIAEPDGSESVQHFTLEEGAVMLEPDVKPYFPSSASVNHALRALIALIPERPAGEPEKKPR